MDKYVPAAALANATDNRRFMEEVQTVFEERRFSSDTARLHNTPIFASIMYVESGSEGGSALCYQVMSKDEFERATQSHLLAITTLLVLLFLVLAVDLLMACVLQCIVAKHGAAQGHAQVELESLVPDDDAGDDDDEEDEDEDEEERGR